MLPGLKRGKWISAAIACELPRAVSEHSLYYGTDITCPCGAFLEAYQTHDDDGKPSGWYIPYHPKNGDEEARSAIEERGNVAVVEAIVAAHRDALEDVRDYIDECPREWSDKNRIEGVAAFIERLLVEGPRE